MFNAISTFVRQVWQPVMEQKPEQKLRFFPRAASVLSRLAKLPPDKLSQHKAYIKSNDPIITGLEKYRVPEGEQLMLIGSTSLNPIAVACELAINNTKKLVPQVVIIDDSENALKIWRALRKFFLENDKQFSGSQLQSFIETHYLLLTSLTHPVEIEKFQKYIIDYINEVIQKYHYDFVRAVVLQAVYLEQKWEDEETFANIKNFIEVSGCKNIFVYPSNIVSLCNEYLARTICQNISELNPVITIHTNLNMDLMHPTDFLILEGGAQNKPEIAIENITAAIKLDDSSKTYLFGMSIYSFTPQEFKMHNWQFMHNAITKMITDNHYDFDQYGTPFLLNIIFRLAGIDMKFDHYFQDVAKYLPVTVFHIKTPYDEMESAIKILKTKFPSLDARFCLLGQTVARPELPTRITLGMAAITETILPLIPPFLRENPAIRLQYETSHSVQYNLTKLFKSFSMSTSTSDCFEETLCLLVKTKLQNKGIEVKELVTTNSRFLPDPNRPNHTNILLTMPIHAAQHIADYFNEIDKDTASAEEKQEESMTKIIVADSTLNNKQFLDDLKYAVEHLVSKDATENYWRLAGYTRPFDRYNHTGISSPSRV